MARIEETTMKAAADGVRLEHSTGQQASALRIPIVALTILVRRHSTSRSSDLPKSGSRRANQHLGRARAQPPIPAKEVHRSL